MLENNNMQSVVEEDGFDFGKFLSAFLSHWYLFIISIVLCIAVASVKLYFAVPQYNVSAKILLSDKEKGSFSTQADMLVDFGYQRANSNVENEIEVIKSMSVARGAVLNSGVYISYVNLGLKDTPIYRKASPVNVSVTQDVLLKLAVPVRMYFTFDAANPVKVRLENASDADASAEIQIDSFPYVLNTPAGDVLVEDMRKSDVTGEYLVIVNPLDATARGYMSRISIAPISTSSSVAILSINTPVPAEGVDYLNAVIESYNNVTNDDKRQVARQTEDFINSRLDLLRKELAEKEGHLAKYKKENQLISPTLDASQVVNNKSAYVKQLEEIDMMISASKYLSAFINDPSNDMKAIPTTFGVALDESLMAVLNNYNKEVIARNQLQLTATEDNPLLKRSTVKVQALQKDLRYAIETFDKSLSIQRDAIMLLVENYTDRYEMSPEIERELLALTRECNIKSDLYVMLLQKYEENALSLAVTADNLRCIDAPTVGGIVSPNRDQTILIAILIGLAIPAIYICLLVMFRTKLTTVEDAVKLFKVPFVGTIPLLAKVSEVKSTTNCLMTLEVFFTLPLPLFPAVFPLLLPLP